jgi:hypothetical protein
MCQLKTMGVLDVQWRPSFKGISLNEGGHYATFYLSYVHHTIVASRVLMYLSICLSGRWIRWHLQIRLWPPSIKGGFL